MCIVYLGGDDFWSFFWYYVKDIFGKFGLIGWFCEG